ncbi:MAG TPA: hypothetical protein VJB82_00530 [Candidatus Peribacterales bacterium]|nr:hypothetical protein [Candidatus Peribacterales bacterium]
MTSKNRREIPTDPQERANFLIDQIERFGILIEKLYPEFAEDIHEKIGRLLTKVKRALRNAILQPCEWQVLGNEKPATAHIERYVLQQIRTIKYEIKVAMQDFLIGFGYDDSDDE